MKLEVDRDRCVGSGMCALTAPDVFDQDLDDGRVTLLAPEPAERHGTQVHQAVQNCPVGAIILVEEQS